MAAVAANSTLAPAFAARRRRARPGAAPMLPPAPRRAAVVRCSLDSNVSDMGVNGAFGVTLLALLFWFWGRCQLELG
jgi:zeta-carotene desaturase